MAITCETESKSIWLRSSEQNAGKQQSCLRNGAESVDGWSLNLLLCLLCLLNTPVAYSHDMLLTQSQESNLSCKHAQGTSRKISQWRWSEMHRLCAASIVQAVPVIPVVPVVPGSLERIWHQFQGIRHEVVQTHQCLELL